jgi:hypothetical protein
MRFKIDFLPITAGLLMCFPVADALSQPASENKARAGTSGWSSIVRGGGIVQGETDLDDGGSFQSARFNIEAGHGYQWKGTNGVSLTLGYSYDGYDFSSGGSERGIGEPWDDIHTFSISAPIRYGINRQWSAFLVPSVRSTGESGANFSDTITGGVFAGASYRFGDRLTIGPGIGVIGQIEESATVFPVLIINWKITDTISLETGRGLAATLGPGLNFTYRPSERWWCMVGGRYEKLRFRLNSSGSVPGGVGEDRAFPLYGGCTYNVSPQSSINFIAGVELGGELSLENESGQRIVKESYDSAPFLGLTFNIRI